MEYNIYCDESCHLQHDHNDIMVLGGILCKKTLCNRYRLWRSFKRQLNISMGCKTYRNKLIPPYPLAPDLVAYCLRHEYCTELARKGVDIRQAQKLMGHATIIMTANIYTNLNNSDILSAASAIGATKGVTGGVTSK